MEKKKITPEMKALLDKPLPAEAIKKHPTKSFLSTIKAIYVTERLNEVFGVGEWKIKTEYVAEKQVKDNIMVVTKTIFTVPEYDIYYECYGGNDNADLGDAYKGSTTDALTKIGSYLGIGANIWKDIKDDAPQQKTRQTPPAQQPPKTQSKPTSAAKVPTPRERIVPWLKSLSDKERQEKMLFFGIEDLDRMTDEQVKKVWDYYENKKKQQKNNA